MGFSREERGSALPFPTQGDLPDPGIESVSLHLPHWQGDSLPLHHLESPWLVFLIALSFFIFPEDCVCLGIA